MKAFDFLADLILLIPVVFLARGWEHLSRLEGGEIPVVDPADERRRDRPR